MKTYLGMSVIVLLIALCFGAQFIYSAPENKTPRDKETPAKPEVTADKQTEKIASLVKNLGADDWETREKATEELKKLGKETIPALKEAAQNDDPEVAWRSKLIIRAIEKSDRAKPEPKEPKEGEEEPSIATSVRILGGTMPNNMKIVIHESGPGKKSVDISTDPSGKVTVITEENKDGKSEKKTYTADSIEEFKKKYPDIAEQYGVGIDDPALGIEQEDIWDDFSKSWGRRWDDLRKELEQIQKNMGKRFDNIEKIKPETPENEGEEATVPAKNSAKGVDELGLDVEYIEPALRTQLGLKEDEGVLVNKVQTDGPAEKIGLKQWDIIIDVNGQPIKTIWEFRRLMKESLDKGNAKVLIIRKGEKKTLEFK